MATLLAHSLKPVQEITIQNGVVPEIYIQQKDEYEESDDGTVPLMDFSVVSSSLPQELAKLRSTLSEWGCVQLVNHGIASTSLDEVREIGKQFFELPLQEKEKYSSKGNDLEGYGNDNVIRQRGFNWNDKLHLKVHPENKQQLQYWPEKPKNFRMTLNEYSNKVRAFVETLLKAMARSLNLDENRFIEIWGNDKEDEILARFNYYPECPNYSDQVIGLQPHGDGTVITILLQDKDVEGLRVLKDNKWFRVPIIPEAIVITVGDQMEITSNGIFKSPTHKVVVNPHHNRISLAMFFIPNHETLIGPLDELISDKRPQLYKKLKNYGQVYYEYLSSGERQINFVKIK